MSQERENGMCFSDRCQFCHEFGEKVEPYLCPECVDRICKLGYHKLPSVTEQDEPEWAGARHMNFETEQESPMYLDEKGHWRLKQDKGLLTPEEIRDICKNPFHYMGNRKDVIREQLIAEAQLAKDNQKIEGLFKEIEKHKGFEGQLIVTFRFSPQEYQSLKDKYGGAK